MMRRNLHFRIYIKFVIGRLTFWRPGGHPMDPSRSKNHRSKGGIPPLPPGGGSELPEAASIYKRGVP